MYGGCISFRIMLDLVVADDNEGRGDPKKHRSFELILQL
jgi:hypothetical protein